MHGTRPIRLYRRPTMVRCAGDAKFSWCPPAHAGCLPRVLGPGTEDTASWGP